MDGCMVAVFGTQVWSQNSRNKAELTESSISSFNHEACPLNIILDKYIANLSYELTPPT